MNLPNICILLLNTVLLTACAESSVRVDGPRNNLKPSLSPDQNAKSWHLGVAWLDSGLGGAALQWPGFKHVIRKKDVSITQANLKLSQSVFNRENIERAWRKYCRHQQDMTTQDHQMINQTIMPAWLHGQCFSKKLMK